MSGWVGTGVSGSASKQATFSHDVSSEVSIDYLKKQENIGFAFEGCEQKLTVCSRVVGVQTI